MTWRGCVVLNPETSLKQKNEDESRKKIKEPLQMDEDFRSCSGVDLDSSITNLVNWKEHGEKMLTLLRIQVTFSSF